MRDRAMFTNLNFCKKYNFICTIIIIDEQIDAMLLCSFDWFLCDNDIVFFQLKSKKQQKKSVIWCMQTKK